VIGQQHQVPGCQKNLADLGAFRAQHHLPESFDAGVALAANRKWGSEVRQDAQFIALGSNHLAGFRRNTLLTPVVTERRF